ncbi:hypothetical protein P0Y35_09640 [Kiritimatiellaeota bacterium B1221]|nr:hypothetical protein [Kiritimatiellaeota bacterium B1221]
MTVLTDERTKESKLITPYFDQRVGEFHKENREGEMDFHDPQYSLLLQLAAEGNEEAVEELWLGFGYEYESAALNESFSDSLDRVLGASFGVDMAEITAGQNLVTMAGGR